MKSIYLRNFVATATMVSVCFLLIAFSFVFIGRNYVISEYRSDMEASAREVSRTASLKLSLKVGWGNIIFSTWLVVQPAEIATMAMEIRSEAS